MWRALVSSAGKASGRRLTSRPDMTLIERSPRAGQGSPEAELVQGADSVAIPTASSWPTTSPILSRRSTPSSHRTSRRWPTTTMSPALACDERISPSERRPAHNLGDGSVDEDVLRTRRPSWSQVGASRRPRRRRQWRLGPQWSTGPVPAVRCGPVIGQMAMPLLPLDRCDRAT